MAQIWRVGYNSYTREIDDEAPKSPWAKYNPKRRGRVTGNVCYGAIGNIPHYHRGEST